ncbi:MAG: hypothetical protein IKJ43_01860 [Bacilli bacterium]|nr:hypothetical protein [Bacilli bacterium]
MNRINKILKKYNIVPSRFEKNGKVTLVDSKDRRYVIKEGHIDEKILIYLKSRNFDYMPKLLEDREYQLFEYLEDYEIPDEQKIIDLIKLVSLLHSKTTHYKEIDSDYYEKIYEDIDNNLQYLYSYYTDLMTIIESKIFPSPSEQLLSRNISIIYKTIEENKKRLDHWHTQIKENNKVRKVVIHGNLRLSHFIRNENSYLISWDKSKIASPILDLLNLYKNHALEFDFEPIFNTYEKTYPLTKDEKELLYILIDMPDIPNMNFNEYNKCKNISHIIDKIYKTNRLISPKTSKE